jgi:hypothetical protein
MPTAAGGSEIAFMETWVMAESSMLLHKNLRLALDPVNVRLSPLPSHTYK